MDWPSLQFHNARAPILPPSKSWDRGYWLCHEGFRQGSEVHQVWSESCHLLQWEAQDEDWAPSLHFKPISTQRWHVFFLIIKLKQTVENWGAHHGGLCIPTQGVCRPHRSLPPSRPSSLPLLLANVPLHHPGVTSPLSTPRCLLTFTAGSKRNRMRLRLQF